MFLFLLFYGKNMLAVLGENVYVCRKKNKYGLYKE